MRAMVLHAPGQPLAYTEMATPSPGPGQVLVRVRACALCRTDVHVIDGELENPVLPLVPGHEVVGEVAATGAGVDALSAGQRVGIPWLGYTCGRCSYCRNGQENLCDDAGFTGYTLDGGYAEYAVADSRFVLALPETGTDEELAPLLCAGLIGYRSLRMAGTACRIGLYGFGAAAHIVCQIAVQENREIYAFTRGGDTMAQAFARRLGAVWAGSSDSPAPEWLDAAILFAPVGELVPRALKAVRKGGVVVCAGIHMTDIPSFPYSILWGERMLRSVANLTRQDGAEFFHNLGKYAVTTTIETFPLAQANTALDRLRSGAVNGAAVLTMGVD